MELTMLVLVPVSLFAVIMVKLARMNARKHARVNEHRSQSQSVNEKHSSCCKKFWQRYDSAMQRIAKSLSTKTVTANVDVTANEQSDAVKAFRMYRLGVAKDAETQIIRDYLIGVQDQVKIELGQRYDVFFWNSEVHERFAGAVLSKLHANNDARIVYPECASSAPRLLTESMQDLVQEQALALREHALGHASTVVLMLSKRDLDLLTFLSTYADKGKDVSQRSNFGMIADFMIIVELLHRKTLKGLVVVLGDEDGDSLRAIPPASYLDYA